VTQTGAGGYSFVSQGGGSNNDVQVTQNSDDAYSVVTQLGSGNTALVNQ